MGWVNDFIARSEGAPKDVAPGDWRRRLDRGELDIGDGAYVYFVQTQAGGPIKINASGAPTKRISAMRSDYPYPLIELGVVRGGEALEIELHALLVKHKLNGDWFNAAPAVATAIHEVLAHEKLQTAVQSESLEAFVARVTGSK